MNCRIIIEELQAVTIAPGRDTKLWREKKPGRETELQRERTGEGDRGRTEPEGDVEGPNREGTMEDRTDEGDRGGVRDCTGEGDRGGTEPAGDVEGPTR